MVGKLVEPVIASDIGVARAVHRDAIALILAVAPQVGAVDQGRAAGVQLGHEGIIEPPPKLVWKAPAVVGKLVDAV